MPVTPEEKEALKQQQRHYLPSFLNLIFAWMAIGLLATTVWSIWDDYSREWKHVQRTFNAMEIERLQAEIGNTQAARDADRLAQLQQQLEEARQTVAQTQARIDALDGQLGDQASNLYLADQNKRFTKALLDPAKYAYDEAVNHHPEALEAATAELERLQALLEQYDDVNKTRIAAADALQAERRQLTADLDRVQSEMDELNSETTRLDRSLAAIDKPLAHAVLNAPMLDFLNPSLKIKQVVVEGIENDINFLSVPRVDRCQTCHVAIDRDEYAGAEQPYAAHHSLDLIGASGSPHPFGQIGCTICHMGRDRGTGFSEVVHTPDSAEDAARWQEEHHWHRLHHWDWPMFPRRYVEAGCLQCHMNDVFIPQAEKLSKGKQLFERLGCHGCHKVAGWEDLNKVGPPLASIATKTDKDWVAHWLASPRSFRPTTKMPQFWYLDNSDDPDQDHARNAVEIEGVVEYLFDRSTTGAYPAPPAGDPARGEELVANVGCHGCHSAIGPIEVHADADPRSHGPNLVRPGAKTTPAWIYQWVRNPKNYWPESHMPDLRLTEKEAADVTAYLASLAGDDWKRDTAALLDVPEERKTVVRDDLIRSYLRRRLTSTQVDERVGSMSRQEKVLMVGERAIARYGCFGCHVISGFEDAQPIGTELTKEGSKYVDQFDFGFVDLPHERHEWLFQKLKNTRIFDRGKLRRPDELLKMPDFHLTDDEAEALVTVLLGLRSEEVAPHRKKQYDARKTAIQAGWRLVTDHNCVGCHLIEARGGDIAAWIAKLKAKEGLGAGEAAAFSPPNLATQGAKVQSDWLFEFIKNVSPIRPWLDVRMPSFQFDDVQVNTLTSFFAALEDADYPFVDYRHGFALDRQQGAAADKLISKDYMNCLSCHVFGDQTPSTPPDSWAPDLALARDRLREDWIKSWLWDPQQIMPGSRMPSFFLDDMSGPDDILGGEEAAQVDLLARWVMSLGEKRRQRPAPLYTSPPPSPLVGGNRAAADARTGSGRGAGGAR